MRPRTGLNQNTRQSSEQANEALASPYKRRHARAAKKKKPQCRDRRDNDRDGKIDYPADRGCRSRNDNREVERGRATPGPTATPSSPGGNPTDGGGISLGDGQSLQGLRPFPDNNAWNQEISTARVDPDSATLIAGIGADTGLHPDFGTVWEGAPIGIPYTIVAGTQEKSAVSFYYPDESDIGPYPIPDNPPIEGGTDSDGDRHIVIIDRDHWMLYELFDARKINGRWIAGSGAIFDLNSNALRPAGWTSADAAGLPIFPGLVRYDEVIEQGEIRHALRFTAQRTRRAYVHPARHFASSDRSAALPPMGMRVRLRASYDVSNFAPSVQVILRALKRYGMILADNGSNWYISGAPDARWDDDQLGTLRSVKGSDFEVVEMGAIQE